MAEIRKTQTVRPNKRENKTECQTQRYRHKMAENKGTERQRVEDIECQRDKYKNSQRG